jgi:hypothetical protein
MKINELFFWVLLVAYDDLCRDYVLLQANEEIETVFYRKIVEAFFLFQSSFAKENLIASMTGGYPILKKVTNDSGMLLGLEAKNQELKGE